jgi:hypothetical protein
MFESTVRAGQSFWLCMAILGQGESPQASNVQPDSASPPSGRIRVAGADPSRPRTKPAPVAAEAQLPSEVVHHAPTEDDDTLPENLSPAIASELKSIEARRVQIETSTPIDGWRFDGLRARYQAVLKTVSGERAVESVIRARLERLTQREQAAKAAATIEAILAQSHNRDGDFAQLRRRLQTSSSKRTRSRAYEAVGFMQSSAQKIDGHKLFVLIGKNGTTVAYLDVPPGLDPEPMLSRKVGVRGAAHYNEELQSRLVTVRDVQPIEARH